jgi:hypothetical protein
MEKEEPSLRPLKTFASFYNRNDILYNIQSRPNAKSVHGVGSVHYKVTYFISWHFLKGLKHMQNTISYLNFIVVTRVTIETRLLHKRRSDVGSSRMKLGIGTNRNARKNLFEHKNNEFIGGGGTPVHNIYSNP